MKISDTYFLTYHAISKPITDFLESNETAFKGFFKREVLTRVMAVAISVFQILDFFKNFGCLLCTGAFEVYGGNLGKCLLGIAFGSFSAVLLPKCFVPFFLAPETNLLTEPTESDQKYTFNNHFGRTLVINLAKAQQKMGTVSAHLQALNVNHERLDGVNGYELSEQQFAEFGFNKTFAQVWKRMPGTDEKNKKARMGCYLSHLKALRTARDQRLKSVLILEDDAVFAQNKRAIASFENAMAELPQDWDLLFLGFQFDKAPRRFSANLNALECGNCMHAYAVNAKSFEPLIKDLEAVINNESQIMLPVDEVLSEALEKNKYKAFAPRFLIGFQRDELISDITGKVNKPYSTLIKATYRIYTYALAPFLSTIGLPKYRLRRLATKIGLSIK